MVFTVGAFLTGWGRGRRPGRRRGQGPGALRRSPPPAWAAAGPAAPVHGERRGKRELCRLSAAPLTACPSAIPGRPSRARGCWLTAGSAVADFSRGPQRAEARSCLSVHRGGRASGRTRLTSMIAATLLRNLLCATLALFYACFCKAEARPQKPVPTDF